MYESTVIIIGLHYTVYNSRQYLSNAFGIGSHYRPSTLTFNAETFSTCLQF